MLLQVFIYWAEGEWDERKLLHWIVKMLLQFSRVETKQLCFHVCSEPAVEFSKPLEDQTVEEEATATLECEVSRENAEVQWFRDDQEIRKTKKYEMIIDGRKRTLLIHDCTLEDSRTYTCDAKHFKTSCFLNVERKYSCEEQRGTFMRQSSSEGALHMSKGTIN